MAISKNILSSASQRFGRVQNSQACTRCGGLLIGEGLSDPFDDTGHVRRWVWRCVQCGDIVDSLILKHRAGMDRPTRNVMRRRRWPSVQVLTRKPAP